MLNKNILQEKVFKFLLIEAKSPEEVLNILSKKYEGKVNPSIIKQIMDFDPTKKFSYTQWAINSLLTHNPNDSIDFNVLRSLFAYAKENNEFQLQTFDNVDDALEGMNNFKGRTEYEIVYEDNDWIIYVPYSYQAERYIVHHLYGGASWCTASSNGELHFSRYNNYGDRLYILANKKTNDIYQYSPQTGEFHDSDNEQVPYPAQVVGGKVYDWFEDNGMNIDEGSFPGPDDILSDDGNYGLKCVNDLYAKYVLCDANGHELDSNVYWGANGIEEYEGTVCITAMEGNTRYWYIVKTENYDCIATFDDEFDEPWFWGRGSVFGTDGRTFYFVSLTDGNVYDEIDYIEEFERTKSGYIMLKNDDGIYKLYDPWNQSFCTYYNEKFGECEVEWYDDPYYDEKSGFFSGENSDGYEVSYNPKTREYHVDDDDDDSGIVSNVYAMSESIKNKFNTLLEKISKNYNIDRLDD